MPEVSQAEESLFADTATRLAADHDVLMCYQLLLGRNPENSHVIQEAKTQPIRSILGSFLRSGEFAKHVSGPFQRGEKTRHETDSFGPSAEQLAWLSQELRLTEEAAAALSAARTWRALFVVLFALPGFVSGAPQVVAVKPTVPAQRQLFGAVESWSGSHIRGWCVDAAEPARLVTLAMLADGTMLGRCECNLVRRTVKAALGGDGRCGFEFRLPDWIQARRFILTAQDAEDGTEALGPLYIPASQDVLAERVAALQERVRALEGLARQVVDVLPGLADEVRHLANGLPPIPPLQMTPQALGQEGSPDVENPAGPLSDLVPSD